MATPDDLKAEMRNWASTVTVVTTRTPEKVYGLTATAFSSLTVDPPEVFVSIARKTVTHPLVEQSGIFCVNFLTPAMQHVSDRFAGRFPNEERFAGLSYHFETTGAPVLDDALAFLDCRVEKALDAGDHTIFIGSVVASGVQKPGQFPLLYFQGRYRNLGDCS